MTTKYGDFMPSGYNCVGDPYVKKTKDDRAQGLNLKGGAAKFNKGPQSECFGPFIPQYQNEKYQPTVQERLAKMTEEKKKKASDNPFKPANPMKESVGLGGYFGCLGGVYKHEKEDSGTQKKKGDFEVAPRNMVTNPSKKGTYGMRGTTFSEKVAPHGVLGEYEYKASDFDAQRKLDRARNEEGKKKMQPNPFKPVNPAKKGGSGVHGVTMHPKGGGICGEYKYVAEGPKPRGKPMNLDKPWRPSHPMKQGERGCMNKFPAYKEDPLDVKLKAAKAERDAQRGKRLERNSFFPANISKSKATPSVMRMNLNTL